MVLVQSYEHKLRSYKPFQCWLLLTVVDSSMGASNQSYLIDTLRFKEVIGVTVGLVCKTISILKIVVNQATLTKLYKEFNCPTLNVVLAQKDLETSSCYSTVLIEQDYRVRPSTATQLQIFAQGQRELFVLAKALFTMHSNSLETLTAFSQKCSISYFQVD